MKANKNEEIVKMPIDPEEENIFRWIESDKCLGSWMPGENASIAEKTKYQFSQVITRHLIKNSLTEEEMANRLGLDKNNTARLLRGYVENFSLDSLKNMKAKINRESKKSSSKTYQNHHDWLKFTAFDICRAILKIHSHHDK